MVDTLSNIPLWLFALAVISVVIYGMYWIYGGENGLDFVAVLDEPGRKPNIAGRIEEWTVSGGEANTFIEIAPEDFQRFVLTFDANTKFLHAKTPDVPERTLLKGSMKDLGVSRTVEIYFASPPYDPEKINIVDTVVYW